MTPVLIVSILLGVAWNFIAVCLMGGHGREVFAPVWVIAGGIAGATAGAFAVWTRERCDGRESFGYGLANYYVGIFVYWFSFVAIQRLMMCVQHGGWTDFDLHDHGMLIVTFLVYGTVLYGIVLIPLCFLSRWLVWGIYTRRNN